MEVLVAGIQERERRLLLPPGDAPLLERLLLLGFGRLDLLLGRAESLLGRFQRLLRRRGEAN